MHEKVELNRTKSCQSGRKVVTPNSKSDLPLDFCRRDHVKLLQVCQPYQIPIGFLVENADSVCEVQESILMI